MPNVITTHRIVLVATRTIKREGLSWNPTQEMTTAHTDVSSVLIAKQVLIS